jgi:hypothetical protein
MVFTGLKMAGRDGYGYIRLAIADNPTGTREMILSRPDELLRATTAMPPIVALGPY